MEIRVVTTYSCQGDFVIQVNQKANELQERGYDVEIQYQACTKQYSFYQSAMIIGRLPK